MSLLFILLLYNVSLSHDLLWIVLFKRIETVFFFFKNCWILFSVPFRCDTLALQQVLHFEGEIIAEDMKKSKFITALLLLRLPYHILVFFNVRKSQCIAISCFDHYLYRIYKKKLYFNLLMVIFTRFRSP